MTKSNEKKFFNSNFLILVSPHHPPGHQPFCSPLPIGLIVVGAAEAFSSSSSSPALVLLRPPTSNRFWQQ